MPRSDAYIDFDSYSYSAAFCSSCCRLWIDWPEVGVRSLIPETDDLQPPSGQKRSTTGGPGDFGRLFQKVVTQSRYRGTYEHGRWIAYIVDGTIELPADAFGEDTECRNWWQSSEAGEHPRTARIGRGRSADAALVDLARRWSEAGAPERFDWQHT